MLVAEKVEMLCIAGRPNPIYPTLLFDNQDVILIDAGYPGQCKLFEQALLPLGYGLFDITKVIITHQDFDHIGIVNDLKRINPRVETYAHIEEAPYIDGRRMPIKLQKRLKEFDSLPLDMQEYTKIQQKWYETTPFKIDHLLFGEEELPFCGGLKVLHIPGHTPGHIALLLKSGNILVGGDGFSIIDEEIAPPAAEHTQDMDRALNSLIPLSKEKIDGVVS